MAVNHLHNDAEAREVVRSIDREERPAMEVGADLTVPEDVAEMVALVESELGNVDILVNCAGAYPRISWDRTSEEEWARALEVNLTIHYRVSRALTPAMVRRRWGRVVNIGSVNSRSGRAGLVAYSAAKAGVLGLTRALARELGPSGICVNAVLPGAIQVEAEELLPPEDRVSPDIQIKRQCVPRRGQPADVAAAVSFLAAPAASFITGQSLHVDGGWVLN
ncbi:SDR family NAD(P)-dependent oxidoreductase [Kitasatospora aureofaciens]|uniref:SDR family NAD(P)-dependent oxidoreductase n=1 Tax=Kitasatospora aureofaciens TaxID=1894 RepID=UPI0027E0E1E5|nr:SDR family oxidoreductase [Kitasatospora aureofaciens]